MRQLTCVAVLAGLTLGCAAASGPNGQITRFGLNDSDWLAGPDGTIWPSDHAGLEATLRIPAGGN